MRTKHFAVRALLLVAFGVPMLSATASAAPATSTIEPPGRSVPVTVWGRDVPTSTSQIGGGQQLFDSTDTAVLLGFGLARYRVFSMAAGGALTHVAGSGSPNRSGDGGAATQAGLGNVRLAVFGPGGDVYLTDGVTVRKVIKSTGRISTVLSAAKVGTDYLSDLDVDSSGRVYLMSTNSLRRFDLATGTSKALYTNHPGTGANGEATCSDLTSKSGSRFSSLNSFALFGSTARLSVSCDGLGSTLLTIGSGGAISQFMGNASRSRSIQNATDVSTVAQSTSNACVLRSDTTVWCAGQYAGSFLQAVQVMTAGAQPEDTPVALTGAVEIAATMNGTQCARLGNGQVWCWGANNQGQMGIGTTTPNSSALAVQTTVLTDVVELKGYFGVLCARRLGGTVWCWGDSTNGDAGTGTFSSTVSTPTQVGSLTGVTALAEGVPCAITSGDLWCWGINTEGRLGRTGSNASSPEQVSGITNVVSVKGFPSYGTTCAMNQSSHVLCWGYSEDGYGTGNKVVTPTEPPGVGAVSDYAVGPRVGCAVTSPDADVKCWGDNGYGGLGWGGIASDGSWSTPVTAGVTDAVGVSGGGAMCARTAGGDVLCWGNGQSGSTGDGQNGTNPLPTLVDVDAASLVDSRDTSRCMIDTSGQLRCWGPVAQRGAGNVMATTDGRTIAENGGLFSIGVGGVYTRFAGKGAGCSEAAGTTAADLCVSYADMVRPNGAVVLASPLGYTGAAAGDPTTLTLVDRAPVSLPDGASATSMVVDDTVSSIAVRPDGSLMVAEQTGHRVRLVPASGITAGTASTIVGTGSNGLSGLGGPALDADIPSVRLATDTKGNLHLLADGYNRSMKLSGGVLVHVAGTGLSGNGADGAVATTVPVMPYTIAAADDGSQFLAGYNATLDRWVIRKVSPAGILSTVYRSPLGEGTPNSMALGPDGTIVVARTDSGGLSVIERIKTANGSRKSITPASLHISAPLTVAVDGANRVVVAVRQDQTNPRVVLLAPDGTLTTIDGAVGGDTLAIDRSGNLFVGRGSTVVKYPKAVHGRPAVPSVVRSVAAVAPKKQVGTVKVSWNAPTGDGFRAVTDYVVQVQHVGRTKWVTVKDGVSTARSAVVTGLQSDAKYRFRVMAKNSIGRSVPSATVTVTVR